MAASMVRWLRGLYVFFLTCLLSVSAFLNLEELNEMKYGIQILSDPVIMGQAQSDDVMLVSSKYKQRYECRLPAQALLFQPHSASEAPPTSANSYSGPTIPELLQPMSNAPCLIKTKDWWTYEFCYGKHIRQYHLEDSEIKGDVLFLGYYSSEFDWTNETAKASKQHRLRRYHSQAYVNGSKCDLNGNPRETEVRFACEEGSVDYIARVDEPQSCRYVVTIHTSRPCTHPHLRPPPSTRPQPIICQPALSPQQYMDYVKAQVSDTKRKVEQISEELKNLDEILSKDEGRDGESEKTEEAEATVESTDTQTTEPEPEENSNSIVESESKPSDQPEEAEAQAADADADAADDAQPDQQPDNEVFGEEKFNFRIISDPADLMKFVQHLRESNQRSESEEEEDEDKQPAVREKSRAKEVGAEGGAEGGGGGRDTKEPDGDEDERLLQEFEEEMADLSIPVDKRKEIKEEMQKEFSNIIDEAQQELESEGLKGEFDRSQATHTLENTLDKLLDRLQERGDDESTHTHTHTPEDDKAEQSDQQASKKEKHPDAASRVPKHPVRGEFDEGDQVKIRVTKYKLGSGEEQEEGKELGQSDPQWQQIQDAVREQLEKAGIKAQGKIEVKILSRKSVEEAGDQWLSEEDGKSFRELLINLLTGGTEEVYKEQKRQQELEDNYKFVWGGEQSDDSQSSASSDGQTTVVTDSEDLEL